MTCDATKLQKEAEEIQEGRTGKWWQGDDQIRSDPSLIRVRLFATP